MLSFVMATHNAGRALDDTLKELETVMEPGDHLIAIDALSTDRTVARFMEFAERAPCTIFQLDVEKIHPLETLTLARDAGQSDYLMQLGPQDHLRPAAVSDLRQCLQNASPDLAVINSGWWYGVPDPLWPRADAAQATSLPQNASRSELLGLCPDPRRLVMARSYLAPALPPATSDPALYAALVTAAKNPAFVSAPVVLHAQDSTNPATQIKVLIDTLPSADESALQMIATWSDDAIMRTTPEQANTLCARLQSLWQTIPDALQAPLKAHPGSSGALFTALDHGDIGDAMLQFAFATLARQQQQSAHLAAAYARLERSVQAALPGPDYLRRLYDRARNI